MIWAARLLTREDPPPFRVIDGRSDAPFLMTADHAGRVIPRALGTLGLSAADRERHIAWDIGIGALSEQLARRLGAFLILQTYSRLVIDCNRPLDAPSSIAVESDRTPIPGNRNLSAQEVEARANEVFRPYHARIEQEIARRESAMLPVIFVAMHSFTPRFDGVDRPWQCGVLCNRDRRLADRLLTQLRGEGLNVGDNEPYSLSDLTDYGVPYHAEKRGHAYVELEVRQDLITSDEQQEQWAERLDRALREAARPLGQPSGLRFV
jgi:predicted N-formylglutamate amidohydrolase